jgi:hypothetical protein
VETDVKKTTRETKEQMGRWHKEWYKKLEIKNWTNFIQDRKKLEIICWEGQNIQRIEVVAPKRRRRCITKSTEPMYRYIILSFKCVIHSIFKIWNIIEIICCKGTWVRSVHVLCVSYQHPSGLVMMWLQGMVMKYLKLVLHNRVFSKLCLIYFIWTDDGIFRRHVGDIVYIRPL